MYSKKISKHVQCHKRYTKDIDISAQVLINREILAQLTAIIKRLDSIQNSKSNKSSDRSKIKIHMFTHNL